ncbi:MAG: hypothetical protein ABR915_14640, partial [Thermoguttaceae bacterium]
MPPTILSPDCPAEQLDTPPPRLMAVPEPAVGWDGQHGWEGGNVADFTPWAWQVLPDGLMYRSYLAGLEESRMASQWVRD